MLDVAEQVDTILPFGLCGTVTRIVGLTVAAAGFPAPLGAICRIHREQGHARSTRRSSAFDGEETLLLAYGDLAGVRRGNRVTLLQSVPGVRVGDRLLGRVLDGRGRFIDNLPAPPRPHRVPLHGKPTPALTAAANRLAAGNGRSRDRRPVDLRQGSATGHLFAAAVSEKARSWDKWRRPARPTST